MKIPGIHVCQVSGGSIEQVESFDMEVEGVKAAQETFIKILKDHGVSENDINEAIQKGFYRDGDFGASIEAPIHA
jgi:hypothetical protein